MLWSIVMRSDNKLNSLRLDVNGIIVSGGGWSLGKLGFRDGQRLQPLTFPAKFQAESSKPGTEPDQGQRASGMDVRLYSH